MQVEVPSTLRPLKKEKTHLLICSSPHFICFGFKDLPLGLLKMLKCVYFRDALQPPSYQFFLPWYDFQPVCQRIKV